MWTHFAHGGQSFWMMRDVGKAEVVGYDRQLKEMESMTVYCRGNSITPIKAPARARTPLSTPGGTT